MTPKVSILIPAYNQPENLRHLLQTISRQTYKDFEVIITDDSPVSLYRVVEQFPDLGIIYWWNAGTLGTPANWNHLLDLAHGTYIKFMHHDDWFRYTYSLEKFVQALDDHPCIDFCFSASNAYDEHRNFMHHHTPDISKLVLGTDELLSGNIIGGPSATIWRRNDLWFDERMKWLVDMEFYLQMLWKKADFYYIPDALVGCMCHDKSVTSQLSTARKSAEWLYLYLKTTGWKLWM